MEEMIRVDEQFKDRSKENPLPTDVYKFFTLKVYDASGYLIRYVELIDTHVKFSRECFKTFQDHKGGRETSLFMEMKILSAIQRINKKALNVYRWHHSEYKEEGYHAPVQEVEGSKKKECRLDFDIIDKEKWRKGEFGFHKITPERKLVDKNQLGTLKSIHKVLKDKITG
ncbi:hypothetical protein A8C32_02535 [Flavivirga aquatica]|uniref:Uncharacterized protein n=1 Tax=Flavivirga aquatica TaxID=1849968 RepID=A0A1E5TAG9_9FLAO|nr:hypothetical protein [Flavivirga aquatica]OEK08348.1 hypothetical protein A8C32_02535 [Flavivirga aquatica]